MKIGAILKVLEPTQQEHSKFDWLLAARQTEYSTLECSAHTIPLAQFLAAPQNMQERNNEQKTALFDVSGEEQYLLYAKPSIMRVLRDLSKKPENITAYLDDGDTSFRTTVLAVLEDRDLVVLDCGPNQSQNEQALRAERITCVTHYDHVNVQFRCSNLKRAKYKGHVVFAAPLPEWVYRPQRREFFRISTPKFNPLSIKLTLADGKLMELPVADLSFGGLGIVDETAALEFNSGDVFRGCEVKLPGFGVLVVDLEVRNVLPGNNRDGSPSHRIGCSFVNLSVDNNALVQRYLHQLQLEAKKKATDDE